MPLMSTEALWDAAIAAARKAWTTGYLENTKGEHCSLGCLGYAKYGRQMEAADIYEPRAPIFTERWRISDLITDPQLRPMISAMVAVIDEQYPEVRQEVKEVYAAKGWVMKIEDDVIVGRFNDHVSTTVEDVVAMMEKARNR